MMNDLEQDIDAHVQDIPWPEWWIFLQNHRKDRSLWIYPHIQQWFSWSQKNPHIFCNAGSEVIIIWILRYGYYRFKVGCIF